jgi:two-component system phosphate regulon sensor histidine kinase PhoR
VLQAADEVLEGGKRERTVEYVDSGEAVERDYLAHVARLPDAAARLPRAIVALHDLTYAKRSDAMRTDFIANVSHELRTPLASLIGFIETLQGPARDDVAARERFLGIMSDQAGRMNRLVDDLLSLSRIELLEHTPPQERVDLDALLAQVIQALEPQAGARKMTIVRRDAAGPLAVWGDRDQLAQVFQNLIDNAIRYGRDGMTIEVETKGHRADEGSGVRTRDSLVVAVIDHGPGIPPEHVPRLTERFYRVDPARSRALGGTGLGLAIVKHIVNRHRGALTVESVEGRGSTFTVFLPRA